MASWQYGIPKEESIYDSSCNWRIRYHADNKTFGPYMVDTLRMSNCSSHCDFVHQDQIPLHGQKKFAMLEASLLSNTQIKPKSTCIHLKMDKS